jgi:hypothetical protein
MTGGEFIINRSPLPVAGRGLGVGFFGVAGGVLWGLWVKFFVKFGVHPTFIVNAQTELR